MLALSKFGEAEKSRVGDVHASGLYEDHPQNERGNSDQVLGRSNFHRFGHCDDVCNDPSNVRAGRSLFSRVRRTRSRRQSFCERILPTSSAIDRAETVHGRESFCRRFEVPDLRYVGGRPDSKPLETKFEERSANSGECGAAPDALLNQSSDYENEHD